MSSPTARLLILTTALLFSTGGTAIKATELSSWQVAGTRSGIAAVVLFVLLPGWRRFWQPRTLLVGVAYAATMILFVLGNKLTTAANTIFLQATAPLYLLWLAPWLLGERIRRSDLALTAAIVAGIALLFIGIDPPLRTAPDPLRGNLAAAVAGFTWAVTILGLRWLGRTGKTGAPDAAGAAVVAGNVIVTLLCLPWALPVGDVRLLDGSILLYLGTFQIGLAYVCMTRGMRSLPALETSLLLLLEPVASTVLAWLVHGERPGAWSVTGCSIILAATLSKILLGARRVPEG